MPNKPKPVKVKSYPVPENIHEIRKEIISHLQKDNAQKNPDAADYMEWAQETNSMGQVAFWWYENGKSYLTVLSTGTTIQGTAKITRYFDTALNEWIYKTEREIDDKKIFQFSRLDKKKNMDNWVFRTFACNQNKNNVIEQLQSENAQSKDAFKPLEWIQETNVRGVITLGWLDNGVQKNVGISTGHISRGMTKIERYYDEKFQEWIYKTTREVDGKEIIKYSRLIKTPKLKYWVFKIFNPNREMVIEQLKSPNAQSKDNFEPLEWEQEVNLCGQVIFSWTQHDEDIDVVLSTSASGKGNVKIKRYFDDSLKEWVYETEKEIKNSEPIIRQFRLIQVEKNNVKYWRFKTFDKSKDKIVEQLKSENPNVKELFDPFECELEAGSNGLIWFRWYVNNYRVRVVLCTGSTKVGMVKVKRFYDDNAKIWLYETERNIDNKIVKQQYKLIKKISKGINHWKFKLIRTPK